MENNVEKEDLKKIINFLKTNPRLTNGSEVRYFEKNWSKWLGVKYSTFVNSGSSANLVSINYLKYLNLKGEIIVSALNWVSDVASIIQCGFKPVFVDIDLSNLGGSLTEIKKKINKNTVAVLLTHILGFNAISKELINLLKEKKIYLIEDVCESHGAKYLNKKVGTFGLSSNFSFYFAHHMTTIEGGMISTNSQKMYEFSRIIRSHGMNREIDSNLIKKFNEKKYKNLNKDFIFLYPSYNFRSTEINAVLGISQLKKIDKNILCRNRNFKYFIKNLNKKKYFTKYNVNGISNYAFVILFNKEFQNKIFRKKFENTLIKQKIEFRRGMSGGGNQMLQPYLDKKINRLGKTDEYKNVNQIHNYGYYIGNYPSLSIKKIKFLLEIINKI
jgi:CDP-6-deoxy-D-xylo-4-hexulose-3-dehydrase